MKTTSYIDIIELVLSILKSYELDKIFDDYQEDGLIKYFTPFLKIASGELENRNSGIVTLRSDDTAMFDSILTDGQQLIVAKFVSIAYLQRDTFDILQLKLHLQDGDFKTHAVKNHLGAKLDALATLKEEVGWDLKKTGYNSGNVWG